MTPTIGTLQQKQKHLGKLQKACALVLAAQAHKQKIGGNRTTGNITAWSQKQQQSKGCSRLGCGRAMQNSSCDTSHKLPQQYAHSLVTTIHCHLVHLWQVGNGTAHILFAVYDGQLQLQLCCKRSCISSRPSASHSNMHEQCLKTTRFPARSGPQPQLCSR